MRLVRIVFAFSLMLGGAVADGGGSVALGGSSLDDMYSIYPSVYHWSRVPVLVGSASTSRLDSSKPLVDCGSVLKATQAASAVLKEIFQEQAKMADLLDRLKDASDDEIEAILKALRALGQDIDQKQAQLARLFPRELQEKDRVRTIYWRIDPALFASLSDFPRIPKVEWAQLEILAGAGGWFGNFLSQPSIQRPMRQRFDAILKLLENNPQLKAQVVGEFNDILLSINQHFAKDTPGSRGTIDWQGSGPITLVQELSPVEACVSFVHLTSAVLLDFDVRRPEEYPNPMVVTDKNVFRLGMGPVILSYFEPTRH